jgi:phage terminase large subunit-like protein
VQWRGAPAWRLAKVTALVSGILIYQKESAGGVFVAVDEGVLANSLAAWGGRFIVAFRRHGRSLVKVVANLRERVATVSANLCVRAASTRNFST